MKSKKLKRVSYRRVRRETLFTLELVLANIACRAYNHRIGIFFILHHPSLHLVHRQSRIHVPRPGVDSALQIFDLLEARADQQLQRARGTCARFAEDDHFSGAVEFG